MNGTPLRSEVAEPGSPTPKPREFDLRELMASGSNSNPIVVIDHAGKNGLDAAAYFMGHGLQNVRCLRGGIDAWAQDVDLKMRRYRLEM